MINIYHPGIKKPPTHWEWRLCGPTSVQIFNLITMKYPSTRFAEIYLATRFDHLIDSPLGNTEDFCDLFLGSVFNELPDVDITHMRPRTRLIHEY